MQPTQINDIITPAWKETLAWLNEVMGSFEPSDAARKDFACRAIGFYEASIVRRLEALKEVA